MPIISSFFGIYEPLGVLGERQRRIDRPAVYSRGQRWRKRRTPPNQAPRSGSPIQRTQHPKRTAIHDMRVDLRRADILVPEQFLHRSNIVACLQ